MLNLSMKHLRYFDALARLGHFGRAAETCAISQPALSMQIRELEQLVGAPLVERGHRQIRLTGLGEEFADRVRDILRSVDDLTDLARASQSRLVGRLRIGVIPTVAPYLLPDVICDWSQVTLDQVGPDRVLVKGGKGLGRTGSYKVSATHADGWRAVSTLTLAVVLWHHHKRHHLHVALAPP